MRMILSLMEIAKFEEVIEAGNAASIESRYPSIPATADHFQTCPCELRRAKDPDAAASLKALWGPN